MSEDVTNLLEVEVSLISSASNTTAPVAVLTLCTGARDIRLVAVTFLVVGVPATSSTIAIMSAPAGLGRSVSSVNFLLAYFYTGSNINMSPFSAVNGSV